MKDDQFAKYSEMIAAGAMVNAEAAQQARVEKLVNDLARPIMVWRFARAKVDLQDAKGRGARTSLRNAANEIDKIVCAYTCGGAR
jgi:hypothetical protein